MTPHHVRLSILEHLGCPGATPWGRALAPPAGVNHQRLTSPAATAAFTPAPPRSAAKFPGPPPSRRLLDSSRGPSLHPLEKFLARPSLSPPSRCCPGSAPTSCRALGSRARAGVPGAALAVGGVSGGPGAGSGRERPAASAPSESGFQTRARVGAAPGSLAHRACHTRRTATAW